MLKIFFGENRLEVEKNVRRILGEGYEVYEGESLVVGDLPSIFQGTSLFGTEKRRILLKNLGENVEVWEKLVDYLETEHEVVVWEGKIDKRSAGYKRLKEAGVEMVECAMLRKPEVNLVFGILNTAMRDGERAVRDLEKIELEQDPFMFFGLLVTQALKKFEESGGAARERRIIKELGVLDMRMKTSAIEPWALIKGFLLRVSEI